ncbi:hypothetical protein Syun_019997 [Stephania yunnanensis]|uniref:O-methyltransferase C-terminal domain-containing protein n=1 Tax=Stephania yunnanensis TaxID=152371 RepID=A0AAP0NYH2_9MAGN
MKMLVSKYPQIKGINFDLPHVIADAPPYPGKMLVYEYIDNGNLEQWLHGDVGLVSPLTWEIRMNIILGTAKKGVELVFLISDGDFHEYDKIPKTMSPFSMRLNKSCLRTK